MDRRIAGSSINKSSDFAFNSWGNGSLKQKENTQVTANSLKEGDLKKEKETKALLNQKAIQEERFKAFYDKVHAFIEDQHLKQHYPDVFNYSIFKEYAYWKKIERLGDFLTHFSRIKRVQKLLDRKNSGERGWSLCIDMEQMVRKLIE